MNRVLLACVFAVGCLVFTNAGHAAVVTVDVTIQSINPQTRGITVVYDAGLGEKSIDLDVSRKAEITVNGKEATLDSLGPGLKAKVSYDKDLAVVTKIEANTAMPSDAVTKQNPKSADNGVELFNGNDLQGWSVVFSKAARSQDAQWTADADRHVLVCLGGNQNWLETQEAYKDFTLTLEWRFPPGAKISGNGSGIVVRTVGMNISQFDPRGIEIDLNKPEKAGTLIAYGTPLKSNGVNGSGEENTVVMPLKTPPFRTTGQWNTAEIVCDNDHLIAKINDVLTNKASGIRVQPGKICLRNQNTAIEFRKIRLVPKP